MDAEKMLTAREVCEIFRIHRNTLADWLRKGRIHGAQIGRKWMFTQEEVNRLKEGVTIG